MTTTTTAFTVDETYDRDYASDGRSRFGAYLRQKANMFHDGSQMATDNQRFALSAWRIAQSPIMAPAYVQPHPRIQGTNECWDDDGRSALNVLLATPLPRTLERSLPGRQWWRGWEQVGFRARWVEPYDNSHAAAYTTLTLRVPLAGATLPMPCYQGDVPDTATAKQAVYAIRDLLNDALRPILAELAT